MAIRKEAQVAPPSVVEQSSGIHAGIEWTAGPMRPVAHWVSLPSEDGRPRLQMIWEIPNPAAHQAL